MRLAAERTERLAAMGEMVAGLATSCALRWPRPALHGQPVQEMGPADRERIGNRAMERLRHLEKLIRDMLLFARGGGPSTASPSVSTSWWPNGPEPSSPWSRAGASTLTPTASAATSRWWATARPSPGRSPVC